MSREPLAVWLYGTHVAVLAEDRSSRPTLTWTDEGYQRWGSGSRVVSHLLPLRSSATPAPPRVKVFLDGLLPEGTLRVNHAMDAGIDPDDTFGLISAYGRDTAGALVFQPFEDPIPTRPGRYQAITDEQAGEMLLASTRHAPAQPRGGPQSTSLAGLQPKIALHRQAGTWLACHGGAASTWILKLAAPLDQPTADVVDTESFCMDLARRVTLTKVSAYVTHLGPVRAIAVERYDRILHDDGTIGRLHQEDLAQALGIDTADPNRKFQLGRKIPSLQSASMILRANGSDPRQLLRLVTFSHLVGNTDLHAKNISFIRRPDGTAGLAPAYDVAAHLHHRTQAQASAMDINGKYRMSDIGVDDLIAEGSSWGLRAAQHVVTDTIEGVAQALGQISREAHPGVTDEAFDEISSRVLRFREDAAHATPATARAQARRTGPGPRRQRRPPPGG